MLKVLSAIAITLTSVSVAVAQDYSWKGFYAGIYGSIGSIDRNIGTYLGAAAGYRFSLSERIILGMEGQLAAGAVERYRFGEAFVLGQAGLVVASNILAYGVVGAGTRAEFSSGMITYYPALTSGLGLEIAAGDVRIRGEVAGTYGNNSVYSGPVAGYRVNVGVLAAFD